MFSKFVILLFCSVDRNKYQIHIPLPPKIDPTVTMMQVEEKPDVTYSDVGGCKEQIDKLREVVETPLLHVRTALNERKLLNTICSGSRLCFAKAYKAVYIWAQFKILPHCFNCLYSSFCHGLMCDACFAAGAVCEPGY